MAISLASISRDPVVAPPRVLVYGPHKVGKTTFGASAPSPIVVPTEEGIGHLPVAHFPLLQTFQEVTEALGSLLHEPHEFVTMVLDSLDWLEPIIWRRTAERGGKKDIEDFGYGKGYMSALDDWRIIMDLMNRIRMERSMAIVLLAHAQVKRFDDPSNEPYDRYQIKLHDRASALIEEWADAILFLNHRVAIAKDDVGFNKKVARGVGSGERILYTEERPAFKAGNRYSLPAQLACPPVGGWSVFQDAMLASIAGPASQAA